MCCMYHVLIDRGFFRGSYTKFMACVNIPFVLPCLEPNCKAAATKSKHSKHWYVVDVLISFFVAAHSIGQAIIFCSCGYYFLSSSFFRRLFSAVGNWMSTTHDVALVRIENAGLERAARGSLKIQDAKITPKITICAQLHNFVVYRRHLHCRLIDKSTTSIFCLQSFLSN